jgi:hypothetical protein
MTHLSKVALIAFAAAIGCASAALAQSSDSGKAAAHQNGRAAKAERQRALGAYGSLRSPTSGRPNPNSPAATGGGSIGYNTNLYNY